MNTKSVTVIGLGPMGQAMADAYLDGGYEVTVWNRTAARADRLVARGARRAPTVEAALTANDLVVLSLTDYDAMYAILEQAPSAALAGRTVANLTSDTPEKARQAAAWLAERGAVQITGGVQVPPPGIGKPGATTYYSGPEDAIEAHRPALEVLTEIDHLGEDPGLAALFYQIGMDMFWTGILSYVHAQAVAEANGISAERFLPNAVKTMDFRYFLEFYAPRIAAGNHEGDVDRLAMGVASMEHVLHTVEASGVDGSLPAAVLDVFRRGVAAGHGQDSLTSLIKVLKR
ncbi:NAD(P)-dependent oxidoreductase [Streptosporangium roseum]|uniref:NAD_Gly3P_dh, NAD-dependent glycerol-3-phosphate dehydrogenase n=1 Tax=Streptosporangium roseum (strain ATCC 12428 / DSM 43021 / JCM 3005 / KCTC 9067 / NCIMB 10171 / NRRL 2505 / NI 9100) TaxID=479432 RepID=D2AWI4_STRRD|nr:NAD(P)-binding domain-containing protein [Streptosporangium roseum]ACZ86980.1 NAD_Gly3P_dh, NAD-dependent glycerol-3-phosphate dehydrogenase [Streptosporangium roseum DSM 43021]AUD39565.1 WHU imine reductase 81 [synthetic construct]